MKLITDARQKKRVLLFSISSLIIIVTTLFVYMSRLNATVEENIIEEMKEIAIHSKSSIESNNELSWDLLEQLQQRFRDNRPATLEDVCERLNLESASKYYDLVYLVDENGIAYSNTYLIEDEHDKEPVKKILAGEDTFVIKYHEGSVYERYRDSLVYGICIDPIAIDDVKFVGLYCIVDVESLEKKMKIYSFGGRGYFVVFDEDGYYIIKKDISEGVARRMNFYEELMENYNYTKDMAEDLKAQIDSDVHFTKEFKNLDGENVLIHFDDIENTDWTSIMVVPKAVIKQGTQRFVRQTFSMLVFVVIILLSLMNIIVRLMSSTMGAKAEAKACSEFLAAMSHEIRTPLNGIIGLNHLMQTNMHDKRKLTDYLKKSYDTEQYLLSLINDILDVQKIQAGKMEIVNETFSVKAMISGIETLTRHRMETKNITFTLKSDIIIDTVLGDKTRIQQILMNILGNAEKYTDLNGAVEFRISQERADAKSVTTTYEVEDNGCGMSKEFQTKIFDSFSQERNSYQESIKGTGLGMNISYMLSRQMGGDLSVSSRLGQGSCFKFVITNTISEAAVESIETSEKQEPRRLRDRLNILVAEDNELNAEILLEILKAGSHMTDWACDGEEALKMFMDSEEGYYDLILMDIQMPVMNGYEAAKHIRALDREDAADVLIYACTANTFKEDVDKAMEAGMNDFISKPINVKKLMEKLGMD